MSYSKQICVIKNNFPKNYRVYVYSIVNAYNGGVKDATYNDIIGRTDSTSSEWCFETKDDPSKNHFILNITNDGVDKYYQFYVVNTSTRQIMGINSTLSTNAKGLNSSDYPYVNLQCAYSSNKRNSTNTLSVYNCFGFSCSKNMQSRLYALDNSTNFIDDATVSSLRYFKIYFRREDGESKNITDNAVGYSENLQEFEEKIENTDYYNDLSTETKTLVSISVATNPTKTDYYTGDSLDLSGLVISLNYSDSSIEKIAYNGNESAFSSSGFDSDTAGSKTVIITYQGLSTSFNANVSEKQTSAKFTVNIRNCENGILYAKRNGADYTDETVASNLSSKSILSIPYDDIFKTGTNNIYFVFYPDNDYIPSERPYGIITYIDASNNEQSFNLPFNEATITQSETQTSVSTYYCDIAVNVSRKTFAFGGYGVYYDTSLSADTYKSALFNLLAGGSEDNSEYGLFNIYKTTPNELKALSKNRFKIRSSEYYYTEIDLSGYITSLIQYPFNIDATNEQPLILGNVATQINSHIVDSVIVSNTFEIKINGHYKDSRDISESTVQCNLPFADTFEISSQYVNSAIKVEYLTDILTNSSILNLYSNDILIYSTPCVIGFKLPYTFYNTPFNEIADNLRFKYQNCNITVTQRLNNSTRYNTLQKDVLRNFNGYIQTNEHVEIDSSRMFGNEYDTIMQMLQSGVYIE